MTDKAFLVVLLLFHFWGGIYVGYIIGVDFGRKKEQIFTAKLKEKLDFLIARFEFQKKKYIDNQRNHEELK